MAELTPTILDPDSHLLLDQPLLRLPHELLRRNLKSAQRQIEITNKSITSTLQALPTQTPPADETLSALDATLAKAQTLKRKLEALATEESSLHRQQKARIEHLQELHEISNLADVKYDQWAHTRLDRLLVDYLLRQGYGQSARDLAEEKGIGELVDVGVFEEVGRIERSLREGRTGEGLAWCGENRVGLRKIDNNLELELRLQQFIELARTGEMKQRLEAMVYARKHLASGSDPKFALQAAGLLAQPPDTHVEPYKTLYSPSRYHHLSSLFLTTHHTLLNLPPSPLLHTALSAGLSALKTPACHSIHRSPSLLSNTESICPICSTELNELARNVPYAHHTKSVMEEDPVVLPNGRVFGRRRLEEGMRILGVEKGRVRDPSNAVVHGGGGGEGEGKVEEWGWGEVRKVFIS